MAYTANIPKNELLNRINDNEARKEYPFIKEGLPDNKHTIIQFIPSDPVFLSIEDVAEKTGWSIRTIQKLFNAPGFPSTDLGKKKLVLASALTAYFTVKRERCDYDGYWD